jgi:hypothetical protein
MQHPTAGLTHKDVMLLQLSLIVAVVAPRQAEARPNCEAAFENANALRTREVLERVARVSVWVF